MSQITVQSLLEAGVHFGHQTSRWNPKMAPYLFGDRAGVHVIDLEQTLEYLKKAEAAAEQIAKDGGLVLLVGTKRQGKAIIKEAAARTHMPYVTERWLGGTLTNFPTIKERLDLMTKLREEKKTGDWERLPKKEVARKQESLDRLEHLLGGMAGVEKPPAAVFLNDLAREQLALAEAKKLGLPIIAVVDSNADPTGIDYPIPGNDDAVGAIKIITDTIADAAGRGYELYQKQAAKLAEAQAKEREAAEAKAQAEAAKKAAEAEKAKEIEAAKRAEATS